MEIGWDLWLQDKKNTEIQPIEKKHANYQIKFDCLLEETQKLSAFL